MRDDIKKYSILILFYQYRYVNTLTRRFNSFKCDIKIASVIDSDDSARARWNWNA